MAVRGDEASPVNRGLLCVKGYHLPAMLYGEDRLTHPMLRNANGSGFPRFPGTKPSISLRQKYQEALDEAGPESVAFYGSGQWGIHDGYAVTKWFRGGLRSNNVEPNARLCMASAVMGFMTQFQSDEPMGCYEDFEAGDDFILWGNNMAEMHPVLFSRILANKRDEPGRSHRGHRHSADSHHRLRRHVCGVQAQHRPGPGQRNSPPAGGQRGRWTRPSSGRTSVFRRGIEELDRIGYGSWGPDGLGLQPRRRAGGALPLQPTRPSTPPSRSWNDFSPTTPRRGSARSAGFP